MRIDTTSFQDELATLRQQLAAMTADREQLRADLSNCECARFQAERDTAIRERDELAKEVERLRLEANGDRDDLVRRSYESMPLKHPIDESKVF